MRRMTSELIASKKLTENDLAITWRMQFPNERTEGKGGGGYFDIQSVISRVIKGILHEKTKTHKRLSGVDSRSDSG